MGNPMPLHKQLESVVGTGAASERTQRYRVMAEWRQQRLIRVVEGSLRRGDLSYPVSTRHKTIRIEIGPETYFTVRDTSDYPNEMLIAQIMLAINSTSPPWIWEPVWEHGGEFRGNGKWRPRGQTVRVDMGYQVGVDQLMHRAVDENSDIAASMMAKQIDQEILHTMLFGDGKASPLTNATLPPPVKRKP